MPTQILMPALSPTMEEGTLAKWNVKEGDTVTSGDVIAEIETDKATMEFEAVDEGIIGKIMVDAGTEGVSVNTPIAVLLEDGEEMDEAALSAPAPKPATAPAASPSAEPAPKPQAAAQPSAAANGTRVFATPLARRIAAEKGIDLSTLSGSGPHGRIVRADVEAGTKSAPTRSQTTAKAPMSMDASTVAKMYADREYEEVSLDGMRKTIAARLQEAKQTIPHFYLRRDIELDDLLTFRSTLNKQLDGRGIKLSVNDFIIKASALALQAVPDCNAVWAGDRVLRMKSSDVAVAVAIEGGLFTPVLRDADTKAMSTLSLEMKDLAARARERKLAPHEYQGGSFAISNLGMMGIENFDAVINPPHASILAVGAGIKKPVADESGEITVKTVMSVTLSVDHRVIDGALGAQFLAEIKKNLENPLSMLV